MTERHEPTPEFRAFLESEIVTTLRRESRLSPGPTLRDRLRTPALIVTALLVGAAAVTVPAQVQDAKARDALTAAAKVEEDLAKVRVELAQKAYEEAKRRFEVGVLDRTSLAAAEAEVRAMESSLARTLLNEEEIAATSAPPRDEISAPLVGSRDFVSERLQLDLGEAQQRLSSAESAAADAERRYRVGTTPQLPSLEAQAEVWRARSRLQLLAGRLDLRREFFKQGLPVADLERRLQRLELLQQLEVARRRNELAKARAASLRQKHEVGQADQLEMMRADVEVMETTLELQKIQRQIEVLTAAGRGGRP